MRSVALPPARAGSIRAGRILGRAALHAILFLACVAILLPFLWMALASFKDNKEILSFPPTWIPETFRPENYSAAWSRVPFGRFYVNSAITTIVGMAFGILNATICAYAFSFIRFPRRDALFVVVLATMMVPPEVGILPNYLTISALNWIDTYAGIIVPGAYSAFGTFLMRQYFLTLSREVMDAAKIDGCGHVRALWHVAAPMAQQMIVTYALFRMIGNWNAYLWPLIVTNTMEMRTLPVGLAFLREAEGNYEWGVVMAATMMVIAPILIAFLWVQRQFIEGLTAGAVKG
ncbi:MAG: carbohydrate ABC transporter permease [Chloroflexota bacterium]|nr:MAG: carbohydrate ABC transporter permease [Chloroflexota bacterium]